MTAIPTFDGHNDALTRDPYHSLTEDLEGRHLDLPKMRAGNMRGGIFAIYTPTGGTMHGEPVPRDDGVLEYPLDPPADQDYAAGLATRAAGRLHALERAGAVRIARTAADLDAAFDGDPASPPAAVLHLEGAEPIDIGLEALEHWYAAGLRSLGPVWSRPTAFGHGVPFVFPSSPDTGPGLTEPGFALVDRCAELGIAVDLSHLNEKGFWDVARRDRGPLIASHSGVHALCAASRNLTDAQLDQVGQSGGLVGIVYATKFLREDFSEDPETTPVELIVAHARYVADRIGVEHVALGSDFDGATIPAALGGAQGLPALLEAFAADGFTPAEIAQIAWHNWRRVLAAWWR